MKEGDKYNMFLDNLIHKMVKNKAFKLSFGVDCTLFIAGLFFQSSIPTIVFILYILNIGFFVIFCILSSCISKRISQYELTKAKISSKRLLPLDEFNDRQAASRINSFIKTQKKKSLVKKIKEYKRAKKLCTYFKYICLLLFFFGLQPVFPYIVSFASKYVAPIVNETASQDTNNGETTPLITGTTIVNLVPETEIVINTPISYDTRSTFSLPEDNTEFQLSDDELAHMFYTTISETNTWLTTSSVYPEIARRYDTCINDLLPDGLENSSTPIKNSIDSIRMRDESFQEKIKILPYDGTFLPGTAEWYNYIPSYKELDKIISERMDYFPIYFDYNMCNQMYNDYIIYATEYQMQQKNPSSIIYYYYHALIVKEHSLRYSKINSGNCTETIRAIQNIYLWISQCSSLEQFYRDNALIIYDGIEEYLSTKI